MSDWERERRTKTTLTFLGTVYYYWTTSSGQEFHLLHSDRETEAHGVECDFLEVPYLPSHRTKARAPVSSDSVSCSFILISAFLAKASLGKNDFGNSFREFPNDIYFIFWVVCHWMGIFSMTSLFPSTEASVWLLGEAKDSFWKTSFRRHHDPTVWFSSPSSFPHPYFPTRQNLKSRQSLGDWLCFLGYWGSSYEHSILFFSI